MGKEELTEELIACIRAHEEDDIEKLLKRGACAKGFEPQCTSPLHRALEGGLSFRTISNLVRYGADVSFQDAYGLRPWDSFCGSLWYDFGEREEQIARLLLSKGAKPELSAGNGKKSIDGLAPQVREKMDIVIASCKQNATCVKKGNLPSNVVESKTNEGNVHQN